MTPAARVAAAIGLLDRILDGAPAEQALTTWARRNRYAGSGDRAAIRDLVFDALRCRRSYAWLGGAGTGRGLMLGALRAAGGDADAVFSGERFAPAPLDAGERAAATLGDAPLPVRLDMPDWLVPALRDSLGDALVPTCAALRRRAPVFLRVNRARTDRAAAAARLAAEGIETRPARLSSTALEVTGNARRILGSDTYRAGLVELQDAASQAVVDTLPDAARVLDYCAGGGGKSLAIAARGGTEVVAHDSDPARMRDIPARAARAGAGIALARPGAVAAQAPFDLVLCDAPCSGSGAWRRAPEAKWRLTPARLAELTRIQGEILDRAARLVAPAGTLAYATCSVLKAENADQARAFLARNPGWRQGLEQRFAVGEDGDGFYVTHLTSREDQS